MQRCGLLWNRHSWNDTLLWMAQHLKRKKAHHVLPKMCLGAAVYDLSRERNNRTFKHIFCPRELILKNVIYQIYALVRIKWQHHSNLNTMLSKWL